MRGKKYQITLILGGEGDWGYREPMTICCKCCARITQGPTTSTGCHLDGGGDDRGEWMIRSSQAEEPLPCKALDEQERSSSEFLTKQGSVCEKWRENGPMSVLYFPRENSEK